MDGSETKFFSCNLLVASAGQRPLNEPLYLAGAEMIYDERTGFNLPKILPYGIHGAGRVLGYMDEDTIETSGEWAGLGALPKKNPGVRERMRELEVLLSDLPKLRSSGGLPLSHPIRGLYAVGDVSASAVP